MNAWKPEEIIVRKEVLEDPVTTHVLDQCPGVPVRTIVTSKNREVVAASHILRAINGGWLEMILAGKRVLFIAPAPNDVVDTFTMPDTRMMCPHFERLKLAANGCFYQCDWCYLKLTYRATFPFITIRTQYDLIKKRLQKKLARMNGPVMFNSGEMADSLALDHLTQTGREFIPWFGQSGNGYLFMLTKSDNVDGILDLDHNGHTVVAWSMNEPSVSRRFEIGAPTFERRLAAAQRVQEAGYPVRVRLDPIVPFGGWQAAYAETIRRIFERIAPERITVGTLRFEEAFYKSRIKLCNSGPELPRIMDRMGPMFELKEQKGKKRPSGGKYSFPAFERISIFRFVIDEIRKYSDCPIALCKEGAEVWDATGLELSECQCVCQLDHVDMTGR